MAHRTLIIGVVALLLSAIAPIPSMRVSAVSEPELVELLCCARLQRREGGYRFYGLTSRVVVKFREGTSRGVVDAAMGKRPADPHSAAGSCRVPARSRRRSSGRWLKCAPRSPDWSRNPRSTSPIAVPGCRDREPVLRRATCPESGGV